MRLSLMLFMAAAVILLFPGCGTAEGESFSLEQGMDVQVGGITWLRTLTSPFDPENPELHYKVYTHLYDSEGVFPITKGTGGKYPHHRGLFIGWRETQVGDRTLDSWSRSGSDTKVLACQQWAAWKELAADAEGARQKALIQWFVEGEPPFMEEERTIRAFCPGEGLRAVDFTSRLKSLGGTILLRGDPQHAGMHVRMAQEVAENESQTQFILPGKARVAGEDVVEGAWWVCASMPVRGRRYWVLHMTSPSLPSGIPLYSIRKYGRFGAFFESQVEEAKPLEAAFRIIWADTPLDMARCEELYQSFAASPGPEAP